MKGILRHGCACMHGFMVHGMHVCKYVRLYLSMHACMYVCMNVCVYGCMYVCMTVGVIVMKVKLNVMYEGRSNNSNNSNHNHITNNSSSSSTTTTTTISTAAATRMRMSSTTRRWSRRRRSTNTAYRKPKAQQLKQVKAVGLTISCRPCHLLASSSSPSRGCHQHRFVVIPEPSACLSSQEARLHFRTHAEVALPRRTSEPFEEFPVQARTENEHCCYLVICPAKWKPIDFDPSLPEEGARVHRGFRLGSHWAVAARCLHFRSLGKFRATRFSYVNLEQFWSHVITCPVVFCLLNTHRI